MITQKTKETEKFQTKFFPTGNFMVSEPTFTIVPRSNGGQIEAPKPASAIVEIGEGHSEVEGAEEQGLAADWLVRLPTLQLSCGTLTCSQKKPWRSRSGRHRRATGNGSFSIGKCTSRHPGSFTEAVELISPTFEQSEK
ncbi:hypothetical protein M9H77_08980 [Catharanthus roseus]|uniref:Uncharacterized protein n=1 Tax=Catharanthus roseus TaxID=4058 RepID=A0ACC0BZG8_CATRO|nr:hypothetical protein M9H77_08980 [Catharanthus roseus]